MHLKISHVHERFKWLESSCQNLRPLNFKLILRKFLEYNGCHFFQSSTGLRVVEWKVFWSIAYFMLHSVSDLFFPMVKKGSHFYDSTHVANNHVFKSQGIITFFKRRMLSCGTVFLEKAINVWNRRRFNDTIDSVGLIWSLGKLCDVIFVSLCK